MNWAKRTRCCNVIIFCSGIRRREMCFILDAKILPETWIAVRIFLIQVFRCIWYFNLWNLILPAHIPIVLFLFIFLQKHHSIFSVFKLLGHLEFLSYFLSYFLSFSRCYGYVRIWSHKYQNMDLNFGLRVETSNCTIEKLK